MQDRAEHRGDRLAGRIVVVTGAAGGQGESEAAAAAAEGATVVATDVVDFPSGPGPDRVHQRRLDVSDPAQWDQLAAWIGSELGRVDGLVNNAGVTSRVRLGDVELDDWNRILAINATGPMLGMQAMLPLMKAGGSIVNVGSVAALTAHYTAAYTTSKWALRGLTKVAATELGPHGIRVNAVHPGFIETPMTASAPAGFRQVNEDLTPLQRAGMPEEVAAVVVFLLSDDSQYLSGADIPVDGAFSTGASTMAINNFLERDR